MQQNDNDIIDVTSEKTEISDHTVAVNDGFQMPSVDQISENINIMNETCNLVSEVQHRKVADKDAFMSELSSHGNSSLSVACQSVGSLDAQIEDLALDSSCTISDNEVRQDIQATNRNNDVESISYDDKQIDSLHPSNGESCENSTREICAVRLQNNIQPESNNGNETYELICSSVRLINQHTFTPPELSEVRSNDCATTNICNVGTKEEVISCPVSRMDVDQSCPLLVGGCSEVPREICDEEDLGADMTLDRGTQLENQTTTESNMDELVCCSGLQLEENQSIPALIGACSEVPNGTFVEENLGVDITIGNELREGAQTTNATDKEPKPSSLTPIDQPTPAVVRKYSRTRRESYSAAKLCNGNKACLSKDNKEMECNESNLEDPSAGKGRKRKTELEQLTENKFNGSGFIRSPCEGLRPRSARNAANTNEIDIQNIAEKPGTKTMKKPSNVSAPCHDKKKILKGHHRCDLEGCRMSIETKRELSLHKRNCCPHEGCGKRFISRKYAIVHQRVHDDERPLKCPWKGCSMSNGPGLGLSIYGCTQASGHTSVSLRAVAFLSGLYLILVGIDGKQDIMKTYLPEDLL